MIFIYLLIFRHVSALTVGHLEGAIKCFSTCSLRCNLYGENCT